MVQIFLFGGVGAFTTSGELIDVGPAKCQAVLAALALSPGSAVPVSRLAELVWGEEPPRTADKTLQSYVTGLRKGLGRDTIVRVGAAYRLNLPAESVDVARFELRLRSGDIEAALSEWTGVPLAGLVAPGFTATVDGLVERWLGAVEADLGHRMKTDAPEVIGSLTELTARYPFREGLWTLLMTALYRVGRQAEALAAYGRARQHLVEELGVEPGPRLREVESLILGHDEQLSVGGAPNGSASSLPTGTVTFGFSEVEDSTRLWAAHRHEMAAALGRHAELVRAAAEHHRGYIFATGGESFGVAFHRAGDAAAWAAELQAATGDQPRPGGVELQVRTGLHTGETEERSARYFGAAVMVAERIAAAGHGGQVLVSGVTAALLDHRDLSDLGTFRLDGVVAEQRILQLGDGRHPPLRTEDNRRGNLPYLSGRLIGRQDDLDVIAEALKVAAVVTLVGPGGIGKTRLALAVARMSEFDRAGAVWLIELAGIASSSDVPRAVADALRVQESPDRTLTQSIVTGLQSRRVLLVLDNCEHVIDGAAELAQAIAEGCPDVRVLATSREGLGTGDERLIAVGPLEPVGPGAELFNERAAAASRAFDPRASRPEVEEICRRLDGVPLAIELAAARTRSLSTTDLVERLDDRLRLLTGGRRTAVERHRTLRATIQWSYDLLTPREQVLFQRLSIFAGPFDLAAATRVAADADLPAADVDDVLGNLGDRSMLIVESGPFGRRFRLLETMRQFGAEHLLDTGQTDLVAQRHAQWYLDKVTHIHQLLAGPEEIEGVARLGELWANLRAAVDWACATDDRRLAHALVRPIVAEVLLRIHSEIGDWVERILAMTPPDDEELIVFGLTWAAHRYTLNQDHDAYERLAHRYGEPDHPLVRYARAFLYEDTEALLQWGPLAAAALRSQGDDYLAALPEMGGADALANLGRFEEHEAVFAALVDRYRADGPPTWLMWTLTTLGYSALFQGRHEWAAQLFDEVAGIDVPAGTLSMNKPIEARAALRRGNRSQAFRILRDHMEELLDIDDMFRARLACVEFINLMVEVRRPADAARMLGNLETANLRDGSFVRTLVADAVSAIAADPDPTLDQERAVGRDLDDRQALLDMRNVLDRLLAERQQVTA